MMVSHILKIVEGPSKTRKFRYRENEKLFFFKSSIDSSYIKGYKMAKDSRGVTLKGTD